MSKLIFALFVLVVGLGVYGAIRRRPNLLPGGFIIDPGARRSSRPTPRPTTPPRSS